MMLLRVTVASGAVSAVVSKNGAALLGKTGEIRRPKDWGVPSCDSITTVADRQGQVVPLLGDDALVCCIVFQQCCKLFHDPTTITICFN